MKNSANYSGSRPNRLLLRRTLFVAAVCGIVTFLILAGRLFYVMIIQHDFYEERAVKGQTRTTAVLAHRGTITDRNGNVLAVNASAENIFISPYEINANEEDPELIAGFLSGLLGIDREKILDRCDDVEYWYVVVARDQTTEVTDKVREFISEHHLTGIHLEPTSKRYYPNNNLACHVIGFVGTEGNGMMGIESLYNKYLRGTDGSIVRMKSRDGNNMLFTNYEYFADAENGCLVETTIDDTIQYIVEKYLDRAIEQYSIQNGGCCILMNPNTAEIYAMASRGDYDLNNFLDISPEKAMEIAEIEDEKERSSAMADARNEQWKNMAIADSYEPGSVFKIITMATAIEEGKADDNSSYYCGGSMSGIPGRNIPLKCWRTSGHGAQTLTEAAQHSCNCAFAQIGMDVGAETFYKYCEAFGLFDKTGIDLSGEGSSIWWTRDVFCDEENLSQLVAASFGQTFNVTPIQMITAVAAACNGGELLEPFIVKSITDNDGNVVYSKEKTVVRKVISEQTSKKVCEILEQVVGGEGGTGSNAYVAGYKVGGKTGTTTKTTIEAATGEKEYMVSFCAVAPTDDPQVICLLVLDNPSKSSGIYISGGQMAAPVVGGILSEVLPYLGIVPVYSDEEMKYVNVQMPYVTGKSVEAAKTELKALGLRVKVVGDGTNVTDQLPAGNAEITAGCEVILYSEGNKPTENVTVPSLYGLTYEKAIAVLSEKGLFLETSGVLPTNESIVVLMQSHTAGTEVRYGSVISVAMVDKSKTGQY